jgi:hypothetical protein
MVTTYFYNSVIRKPSGRKALIITAPCILFIHNRHNHNFSSYSITVTITGFKCKHVHLFVCIFVPSRSSITLQNVVRPWPLLQFRNLFYTDGRILGRVISPSQGRYLNTGQHEHRINATQTYMPLSRIRTYDPRFRASEDSSCFRRRGHCHRPSGAFYPH